MTFTALLILMLYHMKRKNGLTIVESALKTIPGFDNAYQKLHQQVTLRGQSQSTLENYIRRIAQITLHFNRLPEKVSDDEINEYLTSLALSAKSPSRSNFKHAVYGLRYYFRLLGENKRAITNQRILNIDHQNVTFLSKDYNDGAKQKPVVMCGVEFLRRFCQYILPHRFVKIRRYGIYSSRHKAIARKQNPKMTITLKPPETTREQVKRVTGVDIYRCPFCRIGHMQRVEELPRIRSPANYLHHQ
jgi:hypothetical protein